MSGKSTRLTHRDKLLIFEYKEKYPQLSISFISDIFNVHLGTITKLFNEGEIIIPSKMNK